MTSFYISTIIDKAQERGGGFCSISSEQTCSGLVNEHKLNLAVLTLPADSYPILNYHF